MSKTLTFYTRAGCPLCEEMAAEVAALIVGTGHDLVPVDVDADPALKAKYGWDVPLLFSGDTEICRHQLDLPAFQEWLRLHPGAKLVSAGPKSVKILLVISSLVGHGNVPVLLCRRI